MLDIASVARLLEQPRKIVITTHHKPDGDALGSALGLYNYLIQQGHHATVIAPSDYPDFLAWMPGNEEVLIYTNDRNAADALIADAEILFCLDFNALLRINAMEEAARASKAQKFMIDHHLDPEDFDDFRYWDINACATAQLVYTFIADALGNAALINKDVATCLYTGIMTDSASFRLPKTTAEVHRIVASLIEAGAENTRIHELVYNNSAENRIRFLGHCLSNKMEVLYEYNTAIISVTSAEIEQFDVSTGDTEGIVNYPLSISTVRLAAFIVERSEGVKLSLRSKGEFPANEICKKYFNGGGHRNAAGGRSDKPLNVVIEELKQILPDYKKLLTQ